VAISEALGERRIVSVAAGTLEYRERGEGPTLVFVHGAAVNADLWRKVVPALAGSHRCIALDVPLGGHSIALDGEPDLSLFGVARIVADFLEALDLQDISVVGNDTGGAVSQALVGSWPERIGRLVLTSCDAFENFPPKAVAYLPWLARVPSSFRLVGHALKLRPLQRLPVTYGWAAREPIDPQIVYGSYVAGLRNSAGVRRDFARMLRAADKRDTLRAAELLTSFDKPALVAWAADDKFFPREHGRRLAELLPQGRFELVERSRTFIPEDNPKALALLISGG
jgi:pimeloyl-ACP methyl ester carboxylesterase